MSGKREFNEFWKRTGPLPGRESCSDDIAQPTRISTPMVGSVSVQGNALFFGDVTESAALQIIAAISRSRNQPGQGSKEG